MTARILLVEDDEAIALIVKTMLEDSGYAVAHTASVAGRDALLKDETFAVMVTDIRLTDGDGLSDIDRVRGMQPDLPIIVVSAQNSLDTAIRASEHGVFEYFPKPFDIDELGKAVEQAARSRGTSPSVSESSDGNLPLIGRSAPMQQVYRMITRVLRNDLSVLITGESGTGKELVAEAIHQFGNRKSGPFIAVNCAAIPHDLIESELFGHERGAFTGAVAQAIGKFEQANGGTLFLDEIGDMPADAQTRLLRALQSSRIRRVGGRHDVAVDARVIAATNRDLGSLIETGQFREDLFYRLNVIPIHLPALRERREDIGTLARHFLSLAEKEGLPRRQIAPAAVELLEEMEWRGNVRELRNLMFRLAVTAREDVVDQGTIRELRVASAPSRASDADNGFDTLIAQWLRDAKPSGGNIHRDLLREFEKPLIERILVQTEGNQVQAARLLGINRNTLRKKLSELAIDVGRLASGR
ncbi:sigma 54-interacting transcriptional regulator [Qipengyuania atrilutea]|uniref:DNA-binding transcriptional regulator NtrC n=1 Tax=Qipengyuania atrilutea TaxID=2744473 RepID=A0A850H0Q9_9SPHN|nr:sigma 54-interacting transcriptional regulator [Actirhodobacter atriluteus]NVD43832.1 sigma 54-interacting transcriptional regulator [Actirhodobacter atriluteus]